MAVRFPGLLGALGRLSGRDLVLAALLLAAPLAAEAQAPYRVKDINAGGSSTPLLKTAVGGTLYFAADDGVYGRELWKSDGTDAGTMLVKDIVSGPVSSAVASPLAVGGTLFFVSGQDPNELWRSDGTEAGTVLVRSFPPTVGSSYVGDPTDVGGTIFFPVIETIGMVTVNGALWKTDGTPAGTVLVKEWQVTGSLTDGIAFNGRYVFWVNDGVHGREPWISDGTTAGTILLKDINPGSAYAQSGVTGMTDAQGTLFFAADDGAHGPELWKSDGTEAGTVLVKDVWPGGGSQPVIMAKEGGRIFFRANDGVHGSELWTSDGTEPGTVLVKDINPGSGASIDWMENIAGTRSNASIGSGSGGVGIFYFVADDAIHGQEPWKTDGTEAGTVLVKDIRPGSAHSLPGFLTNVGGTLFLRATDGITGWELWRSDGTEAGTLLVADINPGAAFSSPHAPTVAGSRLFFGADDGTSGVELWALEIQTTQADLSITSSNGQTAVVPGLPVIYTITATNAGSVAVGAVVWSIPPQALTGVAWTCTASSGSTCAASGAGGISDTVTLAPGGAVTYRLTATVDPGTTGTLTIAAAVEATGGILDPNASNNTAVDADPIMPQGDLAITVTDGQTVAVPGAALTYTITVTQSGPSDAPPAQVSDAFPPSLTGVTWTCTATPGSSCAAPSGAGQIAHTVTLLTQGSATFTVNAVLSPAATGTLVNSAFVATPAGLTDPVSGNNSDTDVDNITLDVGELAHGQERIRTLAALPGPLPREDRFWLAQSPLSSYEVVVDATSGDVGPAVALDRVGPDGTSLIQSGAATGSGPSRSLRWINPLPVVVDSELVRVRSAQCSTDCGDDDTYRIRAYETTYRLARFSNVGTQVTVLILQNTSTQPITGTLHFWAADGTLLASQIFLLTARAQVVLNTSTIGALAGRAGTATVANDGRYGDLAGKGVAIEPSTGFSFDTPLMPRPR